MDNGQWRMDAVALEPLLVRTSYEEDILNGIVSFEKVRYHLARIAAQTRMGGCKPAIDADSAHSGMIAVMSVGDLLRKSGAAAIEAEMLLAHILKKERSWLIAHAEDELRLRSVRAFQSLVDRRLIGEPIAYLIGLCEFYGRTFTVDSRVLIPRPSTEGLVDLALDVLVNGREKIRTVDSGIVAFSRILQHARNVHSIIDVGTGSGCIAITLLLERPDCTAIATDIDQGALDVAAVNAQMHGVRDRIEFRRGRALSCLADVTEPFIIVSNPPYIPSGTNLALEMSFEPPHALYGGEDGMDVLRQIFQEASDHPYCHGIVLECGRDQASVLCSGHAGSATEARSSRGGDRCAVGG